MKKLLTIVTAVAITVTLGVAGCKKTPTPKKTTPKKTAGKTDAGKTDAGKTEKSPKKS